MRAREDMTRNGKLGGVQADAGELSGMAARYSGIPENRIAAVPPYCGTGSEGPGRVAALVARLESM
jgi:hypothetical protein